MLSLAYIGYGANYRVLIYQAESGNACARLGLLGVNNKTVVLGLARVLKRKSQAYAFVV